mmetsp:Transcript_79780/g.224178  ORF Transcript_79780/g.224178 Transcript_79780/m.224178 type:complete len:200 (+) Transcript_79780:178-777(+)
MSTARTTSTFPPTTSLKAMPPVCAAGQSMAGKVPRRADTRAGTHSGSNTSCTSTRLGVSAELFKTFRKSTVAANSAKAPKDRKPTGTIACLLGSLFARSSADRMSRTASGSPDPLVSESSLRSTNNITAAPSSSSRDMACAHNVVTQPLPKGSMTAGFHKKAPHPGISNFTSPRLLKVATRPKRPKQCAMRVLQPPCPN